MTTAEKGKRVPRVSAPKTKTRGRARARSKKATPPPQRPPKPQRIRHIVELMSSCRWVTGVSTYELADEWKTSTSTVESDAAEASRLIKAAVSLAREGIGEQFVASCQQRLRACVLRNDERHAVEWAKLLAKVAGLETVKHDVDVGGSIADVLALAFGSGSGS